MDSATVRSVLLPAQFFLGGYRHSGRVLRTPILPSGKKIQVDKSARRELVFSGR